MKRELSALTQLLDAMVDARNSTLDGEEVWKIFASYDKNSACQTFLASRAPLTTKWWERSSLFWHWSVIHTDTGRATHFQTFYRKFRNEVLSRGKHAKLKREMQSASPLYL